MTAPESISTGIPDLREIVAHLLVPYYYGGFENQEREEPDADNFRKWKNPPGTPNARAYELTDAILAAMGTFYAAQRPVDCDLSDLIAAKMREPAFAAWKTEYNEVGLLPIIKVGPTAVSDWRVVLMSGREIGLRDEEWKSAALPAQPTQGSDKGEAVTTIVDFLNAAYDAIGDLGVDNQGNVKWAALVNIQREIGQKARDVAAAPQPASNASDHDLGCLKFYIENMNEANWKDMRLHAERQLERMGRGDVAYTAPDRDAIYRAIESNVHSEPDKHFVDRRWMVGINDAVDAILALSSTDREGK